ncbi:macro domain-containing protein [Stackebrandtia soli]|uniref:macro domain-containing protein n=1 Tax=Stackebrandtia soli TaxID=1892856 RepID=UPI0039E8CA47
MGEPTITPTRGDLLAADVDALVNAVNTAGVMGKGIALQFKRRYPEMFTAYRAAASKGDIVLGRMHVWPTRRTSGPRYVVNFPTKGHWRATSTLPDIEAGLVALVEAVEELDIRSIAVPALGCGNGGLEWDEVEPVIRAAFDNGPAVDVLLFPPG